MRPARLFFSSPAVLTAVFSGLLVSACGAGIGSFETDGGELLVGTDAGPSRDSGTEPADAGTETDDAGTHPPGTDGGTETDDAGTHPPGTDGGVVITAKFDWTGIVGTGQSLSVGVRGTPYIGTTPSANNLELVDTGPKPKYSADGGVWALAPLTEGPRADVIEQQNGPYPNNIYGETPQHAMATELTALAKSRGAKDFISAHSVVGWSGHCLVDINKRGNGQKGSEKSGYPGSIHEAHVFADLAAKAGKTFGYGGVVLTHGECDAHSLNYEAGIVLLQSDYDTDLRAITHQKMPVRLFVSQQSTIPANNPLSNAPLVSSALQVLHASDESPDAIVCTGPKYQLPYSNTDHLHLPAAGYRALGEKNAEIVDLVVNQGKTFHPLEPIAVHRVGTVITLDFHVPNPPLKFEPSLAPPHQSVNTEWRNGHGFEVIDSTGSLVIQDASIVGSAVQLTLAAIPHGTGLRVRYAMVQDASGGTHGGLADGMRGQLRDSDPLIGADVATHTCQATMGSATLVCGNADFSARGVRDRVFGPGFPSDGAAVLAMVLQGNGSLQVTLSQPWTGATGPTGLQYAYDLRNYAVHFDMAVP